MSSFKVTHAVCLAAVLAATAVTVAGPAIGQTAHASDRTSTFSSITPCRVIDTRVDEPSKPDRAEPYRVPVTGTCGVPATASAVAITLTAVQTESNGWMAVWPAGAPFGETSSLNWTSETNVIANSLVAELGTNGQLDVMSSSRAHVIIDVNGYFSPASEARAGRYIALPPTRLIDTRNMGARPAPNSTVRVPRPDSVPADAVAVAVNLTTTATRGTGFFTVFPAGETRPNVSSLNTDAAEQTRAAGQIAPINSNGFDVFTLTGDHVIVDITGYFTGPSAALSSTGLYVPVAPTRLLDTRLDEPRIWPEGAREVNPFTITGGPVAAIAANWTITQPHDAGFVTTFPAGTSRPNVSTVNNTPGGETIANFGIAPTSTRGVAAWSKSGSHLIVDVSGWFTGDPQPALQSAPPNTTPPDPLTRPAAPSSGTACADGLEAADLDAYFASERATLFGADYQRAYQLGDGRVLWMLQDAFVRSSNGGTRLVHNVGLIQSGLCFTLLRSGSSANPGSWLMADRTTTMNRWYWPLGGEVSSDGTTFRLFMAEMHEQGPRYLTKTVPTGTWLVTIRISDLRVLSGDPAPDSSTDLYGWSVTSDSRFSYLYGHCYRQFGFGQIIGHDRCTMHMHVARVPKGQLDAQPAYWNGRTWSPSREEAASVFNFFNTGNGVNPGQVMWDGNSFQLISKVGDWFGQDVKFFESSTPYGPWQQTATVAHPVKGAESVLNTYFASWVPWRNADGSLIWGISHNRWDGAHSSAYRPTFHAIRR